MAKYYFHLWDGSKFEIDDVGVELPNAERAYLEACQAAREIWTEMLWGRKDGSTYHYMVLDEHGRIVFEIPFAELIAPAAKPAPRPSMEEVRRRNRVLASELNREIVAARANIARSKAILALSRRSDTHDQR